MYVELCTLAEEDAHRKGANRPSAINVITDRCSHTPPKIAPYDFMVDKRWYEEVGSIKFPLETTNYLLHGDPVGFGRAADLTEEDLAARELDETEENEEFTGQCLPNAYIT